MLSEDATLKSTIYKQFMWNYESSWAKVLHCRLQYTNSLYEITNQAEPRCYTVDYNIQTVYMKLQSMLSQGTTL